MKPEEKKPSCFADLETVFPLELDGLRHTPPKCLACPYKTECLRSAMQSPAGTSLRKMVIDRNYQSGLIGFFSRWSQRKRLNSKKKL